MGVLFSNGRERSPRCGGGSGERPQVGGACGVYGLGWRCGAGDTLDENTADQESLGEDGGSRQAVGKGWSRTVWS